MVKWCTAFFALALALTGALPLGSAHAQEPDPLIDPPQGNAGSRFQAVGQTGWTPGESVTLAFSFSDQAPGASFAGPFYHERQVTVLRDGTWSFPVVVNNELFPFPLWRPGFIVVRAQSASRTATSSFIYIVEGRPPLGPPPLASLGFGPPTAHHSFAVTLALFVAGTGALLAVSGAWRRRELLAADYTSSPMSRRNASMFGSRPRKLRTSSSPSTLPPRSRILRR